MTTAEMEATIMQSLVNVSASYVGLDPQDELELLLSPDTDDPTFDRDCYYSDAAEHSF